MKSTKRIIASLISVIMLVTSLFTVNVFADEIVFPDVAEDNIYKSAIYSLVAEGVINGIEENGVLTFKPDNTITRAEFAKMLAVALVGDISLLNEKTTIFPDLAADHWANECIAYAVKTGIINGCDDGTFRPANPVTYGEAIKMLVCAKGYGSLYKQNAGEAWYQGYIKIANDINLTKSAQALGTAEAKRGMVAQLIYNMDYTKNITVDNSTGGPNFVEDDEEYEEASGIVVAVFENSLTGENHGLNKFQIKVDDTVYKIKDGTSIDSYYTYLGKMVDIEYIEETTPVISRIDESGRNEQLVISAEDIASVSSRTIEYYASEDDNKTTDARLADNLYVIYNGQGVPQADITTSFIEKYFDIGCGEITLVNADGGKDYEIAYITEYETYFVTGRSVKEDLYTFNDSYKGTSVTLENDDSDYIVYKVTSAGAKKTDSTVSGISSSKVVLSVAAPLSSGVTEAIVSTATLKNAEVDEMSGYEEVIIGGKQYDVSDYYMELIDKDDSTYGFKVGDKATFYLDYAGRIVFMTKSESTDPYAYVLGFDSGTGLDSEKSIRLFTLSGSAGSTVIYPLKSTVKVNGSTEDAGNVAGILEDNASVINKKQLDNGATIENGDYAQLIKYTTSVVDGETCISEIYTINSDDVTSGNILPGQFKAISSDAKKDAFSDGKNKLKYNSSSKSFADDGGSNQFVINSSTSVILVPKDRSDADEFKKRTNSYFSNGTSYLVEPYDVTNNIAKAVLVYTSGTNAASVYATTNPVFIEKISTTTNEKGERVNQITYYTAGETSSKTILTSSVTVANGINPGDIVKMATDDGEVTRIQKVYVDGVLYDYDSNSPFETYAAADNQIQHGNGTYDDYYRVILGTVNNVDIDGGTLNVVPQIVTDNADYDEGKWEPFSITSSAKFYMFDKDAFSTESDLGSLSAAINGDTVDAVNASKVVIVIMNRSVKAVYILD